MRCACLSCGYVYIPEKGDPERGVAPGTKSEELPPDWACPKCKADQDSFAMMEADDAKG